MSTSTGEGGKEIKLLKNNNQRDWSDLEWINEFYAFLQGENPDGIETARGYRVKLSQNKAFAIIWYLQEHFPIFPDQIERCCICGDLYDSYASGYSCEVNDKQYCSGCDHMAPESKDSKP